MYTHAQVAILLGHDEWLIMKLLQVCQVGDSSKMTTFMSYLNVLVYLNINLVFSAFSNYFINMLIQS